MLVLTRRVGETIVIGGAVDVTVVAVKGEGVRLGVSAPASVRVDRWEVHQRRRASGPGRPAPAVPPAFPARGDASCPDPGVTPPAVDPRGCPAGETRGAGGRRPAKVTIADVRAAEDEDWGQAVSHARRACSIESGYGAPRRWGGLKRVIESAAR